VTELEELSGRLAGLCIQMLLRRQGPRIHLPRQENHMTMEKRGVVADEHEKKAQKEVKKVASKRTVTGRTPTGKPNQANAPKKGEK